jgi:hypothetical protein
MYALAQCDAETCYSSNCSAFFLLRLQPVTDEMPPQMVLYGSFIFDMLCVSIVVIVSADGDI